MYYTLILRCPQFATIGFLSRWIPIQSFVAIAVSFSLGHPLFFRPQYLIHAVPCLSPSTLHSHFRSKISTFPSARLFARALHISRVRSVYILCVFTHSNWRRPVSVPFCACVRVCEFSVCSATELLNLILPNGVQFVYLLFSTAKNITTFTEKDISTLFRAKRSLILSRQHTHTPTRSERRPYGHTPTHRHMKHPAEKNICIGIYNI